MCLQLPKRQGIHLPLVLSWASLDTASPIRRNSLAVLDPLSLAVLDPRSLAVLDLESLAVLDPRSQAPCHCNSVTYIYVHFPHSCWSKWIISFKGRSSESFHCNISAIIGFAPLNFLPVPLTSIRQFVSTPIPSSFKFHTNKDLLTYFTFSMSGVADMHCLEHKTTSLSN